MGRHRPVAHPSLAAPCRQPGRASRRPGDGESSPGTAVRPEGRRRPFRGEGPLAEAGGGDQFNLRSASVSWDWQGEALRGTVALALMEQGQVRGSFQLPIPARLPTAFDRKGPLQASLTGQVREKGLLTSLFPGFIRESRGELDADLRVGGTLGGADDRGEPEAGQGGGVSAHGGHPCQRRPARDAAGKGPPPHRFLPGPRPAPAISRGRPSSGSRGGRWPATAEASTASGSRLSISPSCRS